MLAVVRTVAIVGMLASGPAWSHDTWKNGDPVPSWVAKRCCAENDVHHLRADQVHPTAAGWVIDIYRGPYVAGEYPIPYNKALPSQDGDYWAFFFENDGDNASRIFCFFAPPQGF